MSDANGLPKTLRCPTCIEKDLRSTIIVGVRTENFGYHPDFYNEDGNLVTNTVGYVQNYECSNRHNWNERVAATTDIYEPKRGPGRPKKVVEEEVVEVAGVD